MAWFPHNLTVRGLTLHDTLLRAVGTLHNALTEFSRSSAPLRYAPQPPAPLIDSVITNLSTLLALSPPSTTSPTSAAQSPSLHSEVSHLSAALRINSPVHHPDTEQRVSSNSDSGHEAVLSNPDAGHEAESSNPAPVQHEHAGQNSASLQRKPTNSLITSRQDEMTDSSISITENVSTSKTPFPAPHNTVSTPLPPANIPRPPILHMPPTTLLCVEDPNLLLQGTHTAKASLPLPPEILRTVQIPHTQATANTALNLDEAGQPLRYATAKAGKIHISGNRLNPKSLQDSSRLPLFLRSTSTSNLRNAETIQHITIPKLRKKKPQMANVHIELEAPSAEIESTTRALQQPAPRPCP